MVKNVISLIMYICFVILVCVSVWEIAHQPVMSGYDYLALSIIALFASFWSHNL